MSLSTSKGGEPAQLLATTLARAHPRIRPHTMQALQTALALVRPRVWPFTRKSLPTWATFLSIALAIFARTFLLKKKSKAVRLLYDKKTESVRASMEAVLQWVDEQDQGAGKDLPGADKVLRLLWDDVLEVRTLHYGIYPSDECNRRTEELLKRLVTNELRKAIDMTKRSRALEEGHLSDTDAVDVKEVAEYRSGEKLESKITFVVKGVQAHMGSKFVDSELLSSAQLLLKEVRLQQHKNLKVFSKLLSPVFKPLALSIVFAGLKSVMQTVFHQLGYWASVIDAATEGKWQFSRAQLYRLFIGHLMFDTFSMLEGTFAHRAEAVLFQSVRNGVMRALMRQDFEFFDRNSPGGLHERLDRDAGEMRGLVSCPVTIISQVVQICGNLYGAYTLCPGRLFSLAVAPLVPVIALQWYVEKFNGRLRGQEIKIDQQTSADTAEVLREIKTIRQFAMERQEAADFARSMHMSSDLSERAVVYRFLTSILFGISIYGGLLLTVWLGLGRVVAGEMKASQLLDVMFKLNFNVVFPARALMSTMPQITNLRAPLLRICDLLDYSPKIEPSPDLLKIKVSSSGELAQILASCSMVEDGMFSECRLVTTCGLSGGDVQVPAGSQLVSYWSGGMEMPINDKMSIPVTVSYPVWVQFSEKIRPARFHGHIEFDDVHFAYPSAMQKPVLQGMSFTVEPGQKVALVGKTGCGKSSVMSLLQRLYRPQRGTIKIDGRPIEDYDVHFLRSRIVIVDQSTVLFAKTLRENIAYGLHGVTDEEVRHACQNAVAWEFINEKPDKLMTAVTTGGANLSGGQRQRVAIARAMIRKPDVILLDEATSALDAKNERVVQEALDKLAQNGSALVVAHRLSTIQDSDKIIVVNDGTKVQEGVHEDLLKQPVVKEVEVGTPENSAPKLERQFSAREGEEPVISMQLRRVHSAPCLTAPNAPMSDDSATYRSFWEAASGAALEKRTVKQMQEKADKMAGELAELNASITSIRSYMTANIDAPSLEAKATPQPDVTRTTSEGSDATRPRSGHHNAKLRLKCRSRNA